MLGRPGQTIVSGFSALQGWRRNASEELVESLRADPPAELSQVSRVPRLVTVPADTTALAEFVMEIFPEGLRPADAPATWVQFGQARTRNRVCLERFAINMLHCTEHDAAGHRPEHQPIQSGGPAAYVSTAADLPRLAELLNSSGVPAQVSNFAGTSLCNQLYYLTLRRISELRLPTTALFVHVPILPRQVIEQWKDSPSLPLEMLRSAAGLLISALLDPRRGFA